MIYIAAHVREENFNKVYNDNFIKLLKKWNASTLMYSKDPGMYCATFLFEDRYDRDHFIMECEKNLGFTPEHESMRYDTLRGWIE